MNIGQEIEKGLIQAVDHAMQDTLVEVRRLSSGTYSQADLISMDHPYATRHGEPLLPPEIINVQTGGFLADWTKKPTVMLAGVVRGEVRNDNPIADLLAHGTPNMFARPIDKEGEAYAEQQIEKYINEFASNFSQRIIRIA